MHKLKMAAILFANHHHDHIIQRPHDYKMYCKFGTNVDKDKNNQD